MEKLIYDDEVTSARCDDCQWAVSAENGKGGVTLLIADKCNIHSHDTRHFVFLYIQQFKNSKFVNYYGWTFAPIENVTDNGLAEFIDARNSVGYTLLDYE